VPAEVNPIGIPSAAIKAGTSISRIGRIPIL
jgi:hypothetical protein